MLLVFFAMAVSFWKHQAVKDKPLERYCTKDNKLMDLSVGTFAIKKISANSFQFSAVVNGRYLVFRVYDVFTCICVYQ